MPQSMLEDYTYVQDKEALVCVLDPVFRKLMISRLCPLTTPLNRWRDLDFYRLQCYIEQGPFCNYFL